jgi:hypothetical protein
MDSVKEPQKKSSVWFSTETANGVIGVVDRPLRGKLVAAENGHGDRHALQIAPADGIQ